MYGDCLELMKDISDKSIDMILFDLPYGSTKNKFDRKIDLILLWEQYKRIIKDKRCIALFAQTPFDKILGVSNIEWLKYEWIWEKDYATGVFNCNFAPMKAHENILIFSNGAACYVKEKGNAMMYNPQMDEGDPYKMRKHAKSSNYDHKWQDRTPTINNGSRYPRSVKKFNHDKDGLHPTQKPVALLEYLIKTYTNEEDIVLDNCMGSGSTGVACINTNRNFIGIELDEHYYEVAKNRIEEAQEQIKIG